MKIIAVSTIVGITIVTAVCLIRRSRARKALKEKSVNAAYRELYEILENLGLGEIK